MKINLAKYAGFCFGVKRAVTEAEKLKGNNNYVLGEIIHNEEVNEKLSSNGVEVINACRSDDVNEMARLYAEHYGLLKFAGSDNHAAEHIARLAGMTCERPINSETDFVKAVLGGEMDIFLENN